MSHDMGAVDFSRSWKGLCFPYKLFGMCLHRQKAFLCGSTIQKKRESASSAHTETNGKDISEVGMEPRCTRGEWDDINSQ